MLYYRIIIEMSLTDLLHKAQKNYFCVLNDRIKNLILIFMIYIKTYF